MKPLERARAIVGEFADDYLIVMAADGETVVAMSSPVWAKEILSQVPGAIDNVQKRVDKENRGDATGE